mmetsp:Transcript_10997/g.22199  ORF Transcript_10997/g.22199 Transcript_10997/m.22199 type:complete len:760 (-) Transcript_10997:253-2532(-)
MTDCQPFAIGRTTIVLVAIVVVAATATIGLQQSDAATAFASSSTTSATTTATTTIGIPAMMPPNEKHPLEDHRSWNLHLERHFGGGSVEPNTDAPAETTNRRPSRRRMARAENKFVEIKENETITVPDLEDDAADDDDDDNSEEDDNVNEEDDNDDDVNKDDDDFELPFTITHKPYKKHIPYAGGDTTHGIMIDAGSQGTRLHIYEWGKRFLLDEDDLIEQMKGKLLSYPTSNSRWTDKYKPGLDAFGTQHPRHPERLEKAVGEYLGALLDFARMVLSNKRDEWHTYPIYLKATGGLRTLPQPDRLRLMNCVRKLFRNETFNPFAFADQQARVISGEEEAIYGWVGVNFAKGRLIQDHEGRRPGTGIANDPQLTYGMVEMGGASTQIANFENHGDLMANLFKLQIGGARHTNVYVHSYLYFGINGAWSRLNSHLYGEQKTKNPCLPHGTSVEFDSWMHVNEKQQFLPRSDPNSTPYSVNMVSGKHKKATNSDFEDCSKHSLELLRKRTNNDWCDFQMDGNCGFAGIYQPPMPQRNSPTDEFIATSNFVDIYRFLRLGERASISQIGTAAEKVCKLNWKKLKRYNDKNEQLSEMKSYLSIDTDLELAQMCFRSIFAYHMLRDGFEFGDDYQLTAIDVIDGHKLGWALGCMLYEINTLPWDFHPELLYRGPSRPVFIFCIVLGTLIGSVVGLMIAMRMSKSLNKSVQESLYFKNHPRFAHNALVRQTLSLPDMGGASFDDCDGTLSENSSLLDQHGTSSPT